MGGLHPFFLPSRISVPCGCLPQSSWEYPPQPCIGTPEPFSPDHAIEAMQGLSLAKSQFRVTLGTMFLLKYLEGAFLAPKETQWGILRHN